MNFFVKQILILILISFFSFSTLHSTEIQRKILMPDKKLNRTTKVLSNTVFVRFKKEYAYIPNLENRIKLLNKDIIMGNSFLKPSESMTFNRNNRKKAEIQSNLKLDKILKAEEPLLRTYIIKYPGDEAPEIFCRKLLNEQPEIEIAEPYCLAELQQDLPDDPYAAQQELLYNIQLLAAWEIESGDSNVVIGISDGGVQYHEDLINSIAPNRADPVNGVDDDGNGYIDDYLGYDLCRENEPPDNTYHPNDHGTNVAGIATATVNNGIGIAGVANKCRFFPMKCAWKSEMKTLSFSYESIKYAAIRGFKVLNCSWGLEKPYSEIDQSIINFAVANDVAIVASGGNNEGSLNDNFPSAYDNVLAVGEVNQSDIFSGSNIGDYLDVLAPGIGNWRTINYNNYSNSGIGGTSYSAPVVSGVVALIRSKYPELDALQSLELARQSVDDISGDSANLKWKDILPGRINAYKAVSTPPFSIPSVRPVKTTMANSQGIISDRFATGDTVFMSIDAFNYLGAADNLNFVLSAVWDGVKSIKVVDSLVFVEYVDRESELALETFSFVIAKENREKMFFRCDIYGDNDYHDFFLVEFIPTPIVTTFSNDAIAFSVSDRGTIGFGGVENKSQGIGFIYKDKGNQVWKSCFLASEFQGRVVSSLELDLKKNEFEFLKPFIPPDRQTGIFNDSKASFGNFIGFEVKQEFIVPNGNYTIAKVNIEIKNVSGSQIFGFTSGYYFDWDIYNSDSNTVRLVPEAIPEDFQGLPVAVEMMKYTGHPFPICGCAAITFEDNAEAQAAGMDNSRHSIYEKDNQLLALNSGTGIQDLGIFDGNMLVGMKFHGSIENDAVKKYSICFGCADNEDEFIINMKRALDSTYSPVKDKPEVGFDIKLFPQPASDFAYCVIEAAGVSNLEISVYDLIGRKLLSLTRQMNLNTSLSILLNLSGIESGRYILRVKNDNMIKILPLIIIK
ncbi:S8 family serine peptidase [Bacteroidota bacterium]